MFCFAQEILGVVYGGVEFHRSVVVLKILSFSLLFFPLPPVLGHALWAVNLEKVCAENCCCQFCCSGVLGFCPDLWIRINWCGSQCSCLQWCECVAALSAVLPEGRKIGIVEGIVEVGSGHLAFIGVRDAPPLSQICHCDDGCDFVCIVDIQVCVSSVFTDPT